MYIGINVFYGKCLMVNVWFMTKKNYCFKTPFFAKNAIFSKIMSQSKDLFWLIQAPYISKHISRNGGTTIKAYRKTVHDKVFFILGAKRPPVRRVQIIEKLECSCFKQDLHTFIWCLLICLFFPA